MVATDEDLVLYRCTECGYTSCSRGRTRAHIEGHRGYTRFGIQLPFTKAARANADALEERTQALRVTDTEPITVDELEAGN